jgi:hypothetical protein
MGDAIIFGMLSATASGFGIIGPEIAASKSGEGKAETLEHNIPYSATKVDAINFEI